LSQVFHRSFNSLARISVLGAVAALGGLGYGWGRAFWSPYVTLEDVPLLQPVPFSHEHHVGRLGFDCRYCHTAVEYSSFAGIPPTKTCMNCHSQIWVGSTMLEPVRESYRTGESIPWQRVYSLPQFVYFDHSIHVHKGIGCESCHGRVDQMPLLRKAHSLQMYWCLECHRNPELYVRPREEVFNMAWQPPEDRETLGKKLVEKYHIRDSRVLTSCSMCHR
jgi:hypothetical protein